MVDNEVELVGISVMANGAHKLLRFTLQASHLKRLGNPEHIDVQRQGDGGFILIPGITGLKPQKGALDNGAMYIQTTKLSDFHLTKKKRRRINLRPSYENGHMAIPAPSREWCEASEGKPAKVSKRAAAKPHLSEIEELQKQIARARTLLEQIEARTGIKITLDHDLRLVVLGS